MKKIILSSLVILTLIIVSYKLKQKPIKEISSDYYSFEDGLNSINNRDCLENIKYLASDELEGRMSGKKGNIKSFEFLKKKFESYGLKTISQKFKINKVNSGPNNEIGDDFTQNLYAYVEGDSLKDEIVVVGAHFDHIGYGPRYSRSNSISVHNGADDNASGTVAVLEVAKAFSKLKPSRTVVFQLYSAEEMGLIGSKFYCDFPLFPLDKPDIKNHVAMINLDMVGHLEKSKHQVSIPESVDLPLEILKLNEKYKFSKNILSKGSGSDHVSFNNKKIPVIFIHTGLHKYYHTPEDDVETLNIEGIAEISKFVFELAWNLANKQRPKQDISKFKELQQTYDHNEQKF